MTHWQKSSTSGNSNQCVEVRVADGLVQIRESEDPDAIVTTTPGAFARWLEGVKRGEFDHVAGSRPGT
ncbi:DUF397 domain-containing protein [Kitasatospora sp. NPDC056327]|uniref:DUF397 domain-containing protein n=1 Tax=Kitasatospora sp. NPDC056327 TaxID=3345785 RepID=UPI0035D774DA